MLDKNTIAIVGYSGHAYVVLEAAEMQGIRFLGYCAKEPTIINPYSLEYLGFESDVNFDWNRINSFILGIGDNTLRKKIGEFITAKHKKTLTIIHPSSIISKTVKIGSGSFIGANANINALATIGNYCILNTGCIVEHECKIGDAVHIAPGAVLAGNVHIGSNTFVGANSVVKQGIKIGKNVIIGAGSTVIQDIPDNQIWVGNPAKFLEK